MNFVLAQAEAIHIVFLPAETTAKAGDMVTSKGRITITQPYGVSGNIFIVALFREARNADLCRASDIQAAWANIHFPPLAEVRLRVLDDRS